MKQAENACVFKPVFEILFGGYATPTKCEAFWRLALNSNYDITEFRLNVNKYLSMEPWYGMLTIYIRRRTFKRSEIQRSKMEEMKYGGNIPERDFFTGTDP